MGKPHRISRWTVVGCLALIGSLVGWLVYASIRPSWELIRVERVVASTDQQRMDVTVAHSQCRREPRVRVAAETNNVVRLRAEQDEGGGCDDVGLTTVLTVDLADVLGERDIEIEERRRLPDEPEIDCIVDRQGDDRCSAASP